MSKIYKGWELMKAIADGEIKEGRKIKGNGNVTYIFNGGSFECIDHDCFLTDDYDNIGLAITEFELIEDEEDVEKIYCTNNNQGMITNSSDDNEKERELRKYIVNNCKDIEEILQVVKQIDKRVKKLEG